MVEKVHIPIVSEEYLRTNQQEYPSDMVINGVFYKKGNSVWVRQRPAIQTTLSPDELMDAGRCLSYDAANARVYGIVGNELWTITSNYAAVIYNTEITPAANASVLESNIMLYDHAVLNGNSFFINKWMAGPPDTYGEGKWVDGAGATYYDMDTAAGNGGGTFTYFPPMQSKKLAMGVEELDKTLYVLTIDGEIWGSDLNDGTSWTDSANFITAERVQDTSVVLAKHNNHLVVFGTRSIEFFYNAANPVGSPLSRRTDVFYNIGIEALPEWGTRAIARHADVIYFVGQSSPVGGTGVYKLENMQLTKISTNSIDAELEDQSSLTQVACIEHRGKLWVIVTLVVPAGTPRHASYVYDTELGLWSRWTHPQAVVTGPFASDGETFPIIKSTTHAYGDQIMLWQNGNLSLFRDDDIAVSGYTSVIDLTQASIGGGYTDIDNVEVTVRLPAWDNNNRDWKFHHQLRYVGQETDNSETLTINWYDEQDWNLTPSGTTTINISSNKNKATRLGRAKSRTYELYYEGDELFACNGLELEFSDGTH